MKLHPAGRVILGLVVFSSLPGLSRIPDEYEAGGGHSLAFGGGGVAADSGQGSVKNNPAMLSLEKQYTVSGTYQWPSFGRPFYQVGAVDSKTSAVATGVTYTSSQEQYAHFQEFTEPVDSEKRESAFYDSATKYRLALGLGVSFSKLAAGLGIQYVEGYDKSRVTYDLIKGTSVGFGLAGLLTPQLRFGVSAENLVNDKVRNLAPRVYRAGLAYTMFKGDVTAHLDYSQRQRIAGELVTADAAFDQTVFAVRKDAAVDEEQMVMASSSIRVQDLIRLLASYGYELTEGKRQTIGGGIALINQKLSLSYLVRQPYQSSQELHHGIALAIQMAL